MIALLALILLLSIAGVLQTYWWYPKATIRRARDAPSRAYPGVSDIPAWPPVHVLMAAHNEEAVLQRKLATLSAQDYRGQLNIYVGSDDSTDRTNAILRAHAATDRRFHPTLFTERRGKPGIINELAGRAGAHGIYVLTDAGVLLRPDTITELVRPMAFDETIGLVDATMVQTGAVAEGIGATEAEYIDGEVALKRAEGKLWGTTIGPFGGCFALRANCFRPVPPTFLVDDFYLCMSAYEQGYRGISSTTAVVEETVGQRLVDEFRRKVRISSGNWQNLVRFRRLWWPPTGGRLAYALFSHKILRWWTPILLILGALSWLGLYALTGNYWVGALLAMAVTAVLGVAAADVFLATFGIHVRPLRAMRYFLAMNAALLVGFYRYLTGITSNVWQPSNRN